MDRSTSTAAGPLDGPAVPEHVIRALLSVIHGHPEPASALTVAKGANLSTLVVIPALNDLVDRDLVARCAVADGPGGRPSWTYQLTAKGRRLHRTPLARSC